MVFGHAGYGQQDLGYPRRLDICRAWRFRRHQALSVLMGKRQQKKRIPEISRADIERMRGAHRVYKMFGISLLRRETPQRPPLAQS